MRSDVYCPSFVDTAEGTEPKYSGYQRGLGYKGNDRGHVNRNDDEKSWNKSDIKETGLIDREPL